MNIQLIPKIEAIIFASEEPVSLDKLCKVLECTIGEAEKALKALNKRYSSEESGLMLQKTADGYRLVTKPSLAECVRRSLQSRSYRLSKASLETLAIIAYRQPITRVEIEEIRGVKCERVLANLLARSLIEEVGRADGIGRPILYGTTAEFLRYFGLGSLDELPDPDKLKL